MTFFKRTGAALALLSSLVLVACGSGGETKSSGDTDENTVTLWVQYSEESAEGKVGNHLLLPLHLRGRGVEDRRGPGDRQVLPRQDRRLGRRARRGEDRRGVHGPPVSPSRSRPERQRPTTAP